MRTQSGAARGWSFGVVSGILFAVAATVFMRLVVSPNRWADAGVGALAGLMFGAAMGPAFSRLSRQAQAVAGPGFSPKELRAAGRAAEWGRVPDDPQVRQAAIRLAEHNLRTSLRRRTLMTSSFAAITLINFISGLSGSSPQWYSLGAAVVCGALAVLSLLLPRYLVRRLARLHGQPAGR